MSRLQPRIYELLNRQIAKLIADDHLHIHNLVRALRAMNRHRSGKRDLFGICGACVCTLPDLVFDQNV